MTEVGGDRVAVFDLENEAGTPIYVHAKVCVVDDTWCSIGSDNLNLRSWTHDSELSCAVLDETPDGRAPEDPGGRSDGARRFPRDLRLQLWAEHLGTAADDPRLLDADEGMAVWRETAAVVPALEGGGAGPRPAAVVPALEGGGRLPPHGHALVAVEEAGVVGRRAEVLGPQLEA